MASDFKLKNMEKFMGNLNNEVKQLKGRTRKGLILAAIEVWRVADPMTPVDLSNLRHSFFIVSYKGGGNHAPGSTQTGVFKGEDAGEMESQHTNVVRTSESAARALGNDSEPIVILGYSANYAVFVHEAVDADFIRPGSQARWFYKALQQSRGEILKIIQEEASFG